MRGWEAKKAYARKKWSELEDEAKLLFIKQWFARGCTQFDNRDSKLLKDVKGCFSGLRTIHTPLIHDPKFVEVAEALLQSRPEQPHYRGVAGSFE